MSLIRKSDYNAAAKNQKITSKKVKLPTQSKSRRCSLCDEIATTEIKLNENETRKLCQTHLADYKRKDFKYSAKFEKAKL